MKKKSKFICLIFLLFLFCCSSQEKINSQTPKLKLDQVLKVLAPKTCEKIIECTPQEGVEEQDESSRLKACEEDMRETLKNLMNTAGNVEMPVTQKELDQCLESIKNSSCSGFLQSAAPQGCEFLETKLAS